MAFGSALSVEVDSTSARKSRGAFFTPPLLTEYICRWAIRSKTDKVLEPACGEAEFLLAAAHRFEEIGLGRSCLKENLTGLELHAESVIEARKRIVASGVSCNVMKGDYLLSDFEGCFDAVVGNPPYVRFQSLDRAQKEGCRRVSQKSGVEISALSSLWVPFVIQSALSLKSGGRIGLVLPSELLSVNYAAPVRKFLLSSFAEIKLITFEERVFPEVQEEVVLLLAEGYGRGGSNKINWIQCSNARDIDRVSPLDYTPKTSDARWTGLFASEASVCLLESFLNQGEFALLSDWGKVSLGVVTGNNKYFALTDADVARNGLADDVIDLCPPGSSHLRRTSFDSSDLSRLGQLGKRTKLFYPQGGSISKSAESYINEGCASGVEKGYKCRKRSPWWRVPLVKPPDAFVTYMNAFGPNICWNAARVPNLNSCHGLYLRDDVAVVDPSLLAIASFNSVTMFGAELRGRSYGGGLLKLEPREASLLPVPSPELVEEAANELRSVKKYVDAAFEKGDYETAVSVVDAVLSSRTGHASDYVQLGSSAALMRLRRAKRAKKVDS